MIYIIGVPIGNYEDISFRALKHIKEADLILCEDTRETMKLLNNFGITDKFLNSYVGSFDNALKNAKKMLDDRKNVAIVSDRGMCSINDPGAEIINQLRAAKYKMKIVPSCCSVTAAYTLSGLKGGFLFYGFLPKKITHIRKELEKLKTLEDYNLIFFESSLRINKTLEIFEEIFEETKREIFVARELTKDYEQLLSSANLRLSKEEIKGECVILVSK